MENSQTLHNNTRFGLCKMQTGSCLENVSPAKGVNKAVNKANILQESYVECVGKVTPSGLIFQKHLQPGGDTCFRVIQPRNGYTVLEGDILNITILMELITLLVD